jgi:uncharacterized membrane protein
MKYVSLAAIIATVGCGKIGNPPAGQGGAADMGGAAGASGEGGSAASGEGGSAASGEGGSNDDCESAEGGAGGSSSTGGAFGKACPWFELVPRSVRSLSASGDTAVGVNMIWRDGSTTIVPLTTWRDVASNESAAVGIASNGPVWWTPSCGVRPLDLVFGAFPANATELVASTVNADGTIIAGFVRDEQSWSTGDRDLFRWRRGHELEWIGDPGEDGYPDFYWDTFAVELSDDGETLLGLADFVYDEFKTAYSGFLWTPADGFSSFGLPEGYGGFTPAALSGQGSTVVGSVVVDADFDPRIYATIWTPADGFQVIEHTEGNFNDVNAGGSVIVGHSGGPGPGHAVIYDAENGLRLLQDELAPVVPNGYSLQNAIAISGDGKIVGGHARDAQNQGYEFIACLP